MSFFTDAHPTSKARREWWSWFSPTESCATPSTESLTSRSILASTCKPMISRWAPLAAVLIMAVRSKGCLAGCGGFDGSEGVATETFHVGDTKPHHTNGLLFRLHNNRTGSSTLIGQGRTSSTGAKGDSSAVQCTSTAERNMFRPRSYAWQNIVLAFQVPSRIWMLGWCELVGSRIGNEAPKLRGGVSRSPNIVATCSAFAFASTRRRKDSRSYDEQIATSMP